MLVILVMLVFIVIVAFLGYLEYKNQVKKARIKLFTAHSSVYREKRDKILRYEDMLLSILRKRYETLDSSDYIRVKYKLDGFSNSELKTLSLLPEPLFFGKHVEKISNSLEEFKAQVQIGRISKYTYDILKYVAICNVAAYPNGRYDIRIPDQMICDRQYKLIPIEKNLLEG